MPRDGGIPLRRLSGVISMTGGGSVPLFMCYCSNSQDHRTAKVLRQVKCSGMGGVNNVTTCSKGIRGWSRNGGYEEYDQEDCDHDGGARAK